MNPAIKVFSADAGAFLGHTRWAILSIATVVSWFTTVRLTYRIRSTGLGHLINFVFFDDLEALISIYNCDSKHLLSLHSESCDMHIRFIIAITVESTFLVIVSFNSTFRLFRPQ